MAAAVSMKVALVTGASYGVGAAIALALARDGFRIAATATRERNLDATLAALREVGRPAVAIELDLRSQSSIEKAAAAAIGTFGRIDVLVNNAGVNLRSKAIETAREDFENVIAANVTGTFFLTQQIGRYLIAQGAPGRIVMIASAHGLVGAAERSAYGISKAGILQMTRMLAIEWAEHGITVNAIAPGRLDTASPSRAGTGSDKAYMEAMLKRIPLHRLATAEEVAAAAVFLTGPGAASITGQTIVIDGGLTAT
jgi:2-deoxy-D-gluconate 3-dehydrogenase